MQWENWETEKVIRLQKILDLCFETVFNTLPLKPVWADSLLTSESAVCRLDSPHDPAAALLPSTWWRFLSGPGLPDRRGWSSELRPGEHSRSLTNCNTSVWAKKWCGSKTIHNPITGALVLNMKFNILNNKLLLKLSIETVILLSCLLSTKISYYNSLKCVLSFSGSISSSEVMQQRYIIIFHASTIDFNTAVTPVCQQMM